MVYEVESEVEAKSRVLVLIITVIVAIFYLYICLSPLYKASGGIEGYVSLTRYSLKVLEQDYRSIFLDYAVIIARPLLFLPLVFLIVSALLLLINERLSGLYFGSSLAFLASQGIAMGVANIVTREISRIPVLVETSTTAGTIIFPETLLLKTWVLRVISSGFILLIAVLVAVVAVALLHQTMEEDIHESELSSSIESSSHI